MLKSQEIPFDIFLMKNIDPDLPGIDADVENAVRQLIRTPQYLMKYNGEVSYNGVYRKDTLWYEIMDWYDHDTMGSTNLFPFDERRPSKFNTCILGVDDKDYEDVRSNFNKGKYTTNYANSIYMYDPTPYTTGYWLGINSGIIAETVPAEAGEITTYTHAQVKTMFSNDGIQGTVKQYVNFLADPSYGTDNDAAVTALDLANTQTFVNKDFTVHPSLFPSLRNVAASCISSDRTQLWLAYEAGGLDCVDAADGSIVAHYSAKDLAQGRALLLVQDEAAGVIYLVTENGVSQINV